MIEGVFDHLKFNICRDDGFPSPPSVRDHIGSRTEGEKCHLLLDGSISGDPALRKKWAVSRYPHLAALSRPDLTGTAWKPRSFGDVRTRCGLAAEYLRRLLHRPRLALPVVMLVKRLARRSVSSKLTHPPIERTRCVRGRPWFRRIPPLIFYVPFCEPKDRRAAVRTSCRAQVRNLPDEASHSGRSLCLRSRSDGTGRCWWLDERNVSAM